MRLADLSEHRLDRMQIVADRAVESDLTAASALCDDSNRAARVETGADGRLRLRQN
jgi:hypothetical protein